MAGRGEGGLDLALHLLDQVAAAAARLGHRLGQDRVAPGPQMAERQFLQFAVGLVEARAGARSARRCRASPCEMRRPLLARRIVQRAHVVRAVGQLDQDDAHVARHGQQHLAERLGLVLLARVELELVQLGEAVDQFGHRGAEALDQLRLGDPAILDRVVQQGRHQGLGVELPFGALGGHGDRMGDVGLAAVAQLPQVGLVGEAVGAAHLLDVFGVQVVEPAVSAAKLAAAAFSAAGLAAERRAGGAGLGVGLGFGDRAHDSRL